jgi:hypothetical protein
MASDSQLNSGQVTEMEDGRIRHAFLEWTTDAVDMLTKAKRRAH